MSITKLIGKIKNTPPSADLGEVEVVSFDKDGHIERFGWARKLFLSIVIILVAFLSFGIGRLSVVGEREPIRIEYDPEISNSQFPISNQNSITNLQTNQTASVINTVVNGSVVVSKNGTRYHYPHCSGAKQIKEENKIVFTTPSAAEAAGYTLAINCKPR